MCGNFTGVLHFEQGCESVDGGKGDDDEKIGHLPDWNSLSAVADDAENREQTERQAHSHIDPAHCVEQQQHCRRKCQESEDIVFAAALRVVEKMHENPADKKVEEKPDCQFSKALSRAHRRVQNALNVEKVAVFQGCGACLKQMYHIFLLSFRTYYRVNGLIIVLVGLLSCLLALFYKTVFAGAAVLLIFSISLNLVLKRPGWTEGAVETIPMQYLLTRTGFTL